MVEINELARKRGTLIANAAVASQNKTLIDDPVTTEAIELNVIAPLFVEISERDQRIAALEAQLAEAKRRKQELEREVTGLRNSYFDERRARLSALEATPPAPADNDGSMTPEEIRLEDLKQMAAYSGPIVSFEVREPYYLASCDHCGWVGSTEHCGTDSWGDDSDVYCPRCHASGADCGKVAARIATPPAPKVTEAAFEQMARALVPFAYGAFEQRGTETVPFEPGKPNANCYNAVRALTAAQEEGR